MDSAQKAFLIDGQHLGIAQRTDGCAAFFTSEEGHLTKKVIWAQGSQSEFLSVLIYSDRFNFSSLYYIHTVADFPLVKNNFTVLIFFTQTGHMF